MENIMVARKEVAEKDLKQARKFLKLTGLSNQYSVAFRTNKSDGDHYALILNADTYTKTIAKSGSMMRLLDRFIKRNGNCMRIWNQLQQEKYGMTSTTETTPEDTSQLNYKIARAKDFISALRRGTLSDPHNSRIVLSIRTHSPSPNAPKQTYYSIVEKFNNGQIKTITRSTNLDDLMTQLTSRSYMLTKAWKEHCERYPKGHRYLGSQTTIYC